MGVLWIYPKKGSTIGLREISYQFDNEIMGKSGRDLDFRCIPLLHFIPTCAIIIPEHIPKRTD